MIRAAYPARKDQPSQTTARIEPSSVLQPSKNEQEISVRYNLYCESYNLYLQQLFIVSGPLFLRLRGHNFNLVQQLIENSRIFDSVFGAFSTLTAKTKQPCSKP
jgi:hypothetical protein